MVVICGGGPAGGPVVETHITGLIPAGRSSPVSPVSHPINVLPMLSVMSSVQVWWVGGGLALPCGGKCPICKVSISHSDRLKSDTHTSLSAAGVELEHTTCSKPDLNKGSNTTFIC